MNTRDEKGKAQHEKMTQQKQAHSRCHDVKNIAPAPASTPHVLQHLDAQLDLDVYTDAERQCANTRERRNRC
jgi:hypothetical protein